MSRFCTTICSIPSCLSRSEKWSAHNQPAPVLGHEIDGLGSGAFRRHDQVALVFSVGVIDDDDHPPGAHFREDGLNGVKRFLHKFRKKLIVQGTIASHKSAQLRFFETLNRVARSAFSICCIAIGIGRRRRLRFELRTRRRMQLRSAVKICYSATPKNQMRQQNRSSLISRGVSMFNACSCLSFCLGSRIKLRFGLAQLQLICLLLAAHSVAAARRILKNPSSNPPVQPAAV